MTPPYPAFARSERIADGVIHLLGVILALTGAVLLIVFAGFWAGAGQIAAVSVYGTAMIAMFVAAACYHMAPWEALRPALRRVDHAEIYLKIAGTYTPLVVMIGSGFSYALLGLVWILALAGALAKLFFWATPGRFAPLLYLLLGWLSLTLIWSLAHSLPVPATVLIMIGGLLYSAGVMFFNWAMLKFSTAIWHGFVLAASGCFFAAITLGTLSGVS